MNGQTANVLLGGSVEGSCIRKCYVNQQQKFIQVAAFTSLPSQLRDRIARGAISAAAWRNFLLFVKVILPACNWNLANLQAAIGQCVRTVTVRGRRACLLTLLQDKCYCV